MSETLAALTDRACAWSEQVGHSFEPRDIALKIAEEAGEVAGEIVKRNEHRPDGIDRTERLHRELADLGIAWAKLCRVERVDPLVLMAERIAHNEARPASERPAAPSPQVAVEQDGGPEPVLRPPTKCGRVLANGRCGLTLNHPGACGVLMASPAVEQPTPEAEPGNSGDPR